MSYKAYFRKRRSIRKGRKESELVRFVRKAKKAFSLKRTYEKGDKDDRLN